MKAIALFVTGCLAGGALAYMVVGTSDDNRATDADADSQYRSVADFASSRVRAESVPAISVADSLSIYETAARETSLENLALALETAATAVPTPERGVQIDALISRLSDLDAALAAALTTSSGLEAHFVADAYLNWAEADQPAAIGDLVSIESSTLRIEVALALLEAVGDDASALERIAAEFSESERSRLTVERLGQRAEFDPIGAFREAQLLDSSSQQRRALERVAFAWADQDPVGALSQVDLLPPALRTTFRQNVISEWARADSAGYLAWLEASDALEVESVLGVQYLAYSDPERILNLGETITGDPGRYMQSLALTALAELDPEAAIARVDQMSPSSIREASLMSVGQAIARSNPDAVLAWANRLQPPSRNLITAVVIAMAETDPGRAVEILDDPPAGIQAQLISSVLTSVMARNPEQARVYADRLVAGDSIEASNALQNLIGSWVRQDPASALDWVLAHDTEVSAGVFGNAAQSMARLDPVTAAAYVARVPEEYRGAWIVRVAGPYGQSDPAAALAWAAQFQGQDIYDDALRQVITGTAAVDPRAASELVTRTSTEVQLGAGQQVALAWARQDPRAASRWAATLDDPTVREAAITASVSTWASTDPSAARNWAMDLTRGPERDSALNAVVSRIAVTGDFDRSVLNAFSTESARQEALRRVIPVLSRENPDEAQELVGLITNGTVRSQLEQQIERFRSQGL